MAACRIASSIHCEKRCVAGGPGGISCVNNQHTAGISIHHFPNRNRINHSLDYGYNLLAGIGLIGAHLVVKQYIRLTKKG